MRTMTSPFRKACTIFGPPPHKEGKKQPQQQQPTSAMMHHIVEAERAKLHCEVMACAYEDVQVMWSMLDKAKIQEFNGS